MNETSLKNGGRSIIKIGLGARKICRNVFKICMKKKIKNPCSWGKRYNSRNISSNSSLAMDIKMLSSSTSLMRLTSLKSNRYKCLIFQFYKTDSVYFSSL